MYFENLLNAVLGQREILHIKECEICGYDEIYFIDTHTEKQIGRACHECRLVQKFNFIQ
jgi:hypothetical protein